MPKINKHIVAVDGMEYVPRLYAVAKCVQGGQLCPKCHEDNSVVYDCRLDYKYKGKYRRRRCLECGYEWKTLEILYPDYESEESNEKGD